MKKYKTITWQEAQDLWELGVFDFEWHNDYTKTWHPYLPEGQEIASTYSPLEMSRKGKAWQSYRIAVE